MTLPGIVSYAFHPHDPLNWRTALSTGDINLTLEQTLSGKEKQTFEIKLIRNIDKDKIYELLRWQRLSVNSKALSYSMLGAVQNNHSR